MSLKFFLLASILIFSLFLNFASAKIILPEFKEIYSTGDAIDSSFEIMESQEVNGLVKLELDCAERTVFYTSPILLKANEAKKITVSPYTLTKEGKCHVDASLSDQNNFSDETKSNDFLTSNFINVSLKLNKESFMPGNTIRIKGEAKKANGQYVDGIASINLGNEGYSAIVKNGAFEFSTDLKNNFPSGENEIAVKVTDSSGNSGTASKTISVASIPTSLEISANNNTFLPGSKLTTAAALYDQSGKEMNTAISLTLYDSWGADAAKKIINNSESLEYNFNKDSPTGEWWIYAYAEGIRVRRFISVAEETKIDAALNESTIRIFNIGNTYFKKPVEIIFKNAGTEEKRIEELNLGINGEKELKITAPEGNYDLTVRTDNFEKTFENVYLTGKAIGVEAPGMKSFRIAQNIIAIAIIIALAYLVIFLKIKSTKNKGIVVGKTYNPNTKRFKDKN